MANITRWNPEADLLSLRDAMDRLLSESFVRPFGMTSFWGGASSMMPVDVVETEKDVVVKAAVPGLSPDQINIQLEGDTLTIKGEYRQETQPEQGEKGTVHYRELRYGSMQRTITLPTEVNADQCRAVVENGILTLTLPKAEHARPKSIKIQGGGQRQIEQQNK